MRYALRPQFERIALAFLFVAATTISANGAEKTWNGSAATANWSAGPWSPAGVPVAGDNIHLNRSNTTSQTVTYDPAGPAYYITLEVNNLSGSGSDFTLAIGDGHNFATTLEQYIGTLGRGHIVQTGGSNTVGASGIYLGNAVGTVGTYDINGGMLTTTNIQVGGPAGGAGSFNLSNASDSISGFVTATGNVTVGSPASGQGALNVSGGFLRIGYTPNQGGNNLNSVLGVYDSGSNAINLSGGEIDAGSFSGNPSRLNWTGGTLNVFGTQGLIIDDSRVSTLGASLTLDANKQLFQERTDFTNSNMNEEIGFSGTGSVTQNGGLHVVLVSGLVEGGVMTLGYGAGSKGTYNLNDGTNMADRLNVGLGGTGIFNQAGGTNLVNSTLQVGATGTYNQSGGGNSANDIMVSGTFNLSGGNTAAIGTLIVGAGGTYNQTGGNTDGQSTLGIFGNFNLSGGTATSSSGLVHVGIGTLTVSGTGVLNANGAGGLQLDESGQINLSGGTINASDFSIEYESQFTWTSGTLNFIAAHTFSDAALGATFTVGAGQTLSDQGDATISDSFSFSDFHLTLNAGGTFTAPNIKLVNGTLTASAGSTINGNVTQTGGVLDGRFVNLSTFTYQGGEFRGRLVNQGVVNLPPTFVAGNGYENDVAQSLAAGQALTANGAGYDNQGTLTVTGGALTSNGGSNEGLIAFETATTNLGTLTAVGTFTNAASGIIVVRADKVGTLNGAIANAGEVQLGGATATLTGTGGLTNSGLVRGDGIVAKAVTNVVGGELRAEAGKRLLFTAASGTNAGRLNLQGGTAEFSQPLTNGATGQILGRGTLKVGGAGLSNQGNVAFSSGITDVFGKFANNTGTSARGISIATNAEVTFWDDVVNTSGLFKVNAGSSATFFGAFSGNGLTGGGNVDFEALFSPGFSPAADSFAGNVNLGAASQLKMELGGTSPGTQYDSVYVAGQFAVDGTLAISLINGFVPVAGDSFNLFDWGSISGTFATLNLPALGNGLTWNTSQIYMNGVLSVIAPGILGDYNNNGVVDAADYVVWRANQGTSNVLANDPIGGMIGAAQFNQWRAHFGQTAGSGAGVIANTAVPEPTTLALLTFATTSWCLRRRRAA